MNPLAVHFDMIRASDMLLLSDDPHPSIPEMILAGNRRNRPANKAGKLSGQMSPSISRPYDQGLNTI